MMAYAEPNCFIGIIFGTDGHIADGTSENEMPRITMIMMANHQALRIGKANKMCTVVTS